MSQQDKLIEHGNDVATWLMDGEDDSTFVVLSEVDETLNDIVGIVGVEAYIEIIRMF